MILNLGRCTLVIHTVIQKFAYHWKTRLPGSMGDPIWTGISTIAYVDIGVTNQRLKDMPWNFPTCCIQFMIKRPQVMDSSWNSAKFDRWTISVVPVVPEIPPSPPKYLYDIDYFCPVSRFLAISMFLRVAAKYRDKWGQLYWSRNGHLATCTISVKMLQTIRHYQCLRIFVSKENFPACFR